MAVTIWSLAIRAVPEAFIVIWTGTRLAGIKTTFKPLLWAAMILGGITFLFRSLIPVKFGMHTLVALFFYILLVHLFFKPNIKGAIAAALSGFITAGVAEMATYPIIDFFHTPVELVEQSTELQLLYGIPSLALTVIIGWLGGMIIDKIKKMSLAASSKAMENNTHDV